MNPSVIDTLRFANALKDAGVDPGQAEAMSRAFNDELAQGVATKQDLDNAVTELTGEVAKVDAKLDAMESKFDAKLDAMESKFDAKFDAMDSKFHAMDEKFGALSRQFGTQGRYVFLVLTLVAALGFYNAVAPHFVGKPVGGVQPGTSVTAAPVAGQASDQPPTVASGS